MLKRGCCKLDELAAALVVLEINSTERTKQSGQSPIPRKRTGIRKMVSFVCNINRVFKVFILQLFLSHQYTVSYYCSK